MDHGGWYGGRAKYYQSKPSHSHCLSSLSATTLVYFNYQMQYNLLSNFLLLISTPAEGG